MKPKLIVIVSLLVSSLKAFSFQDSVYSEKQYFYHIHDKLFIKPQLTLRHTGFSFRDAKRESAPQYYILPWYHSAGLSLYIFDLKLSASYQTNRTPGTKGRFDIHTMWSSGPFGVDFSFLRQGVTTTQQMEIPIQSNKAVSASDRLFILSKKASIRS